MEIVKDIDVFVNILANLLTMFASGIAIYLFIFKREKLIHAMRLILNYTTQLSLNDLRLKVEILNNVKTSNEECFVVLNEIDGQIKGSKFFKEKLKDILVRIQYFTDDPKLLTENSKGNFVNELRETLRSIEIENFQKIVENE